MKLKRIGKSRKPATATKVVFKHTRRLLAGLAVSLGLMAYAGGVAEAGNLIADPTLLTLGTSSSPWGLNNGAIGTIESGPFAGYDFFQSGCVSNCFDPVNGSFISQTITIPEAGLYDFSFLLDSDLGASLGSPAGTPNAVEVNIFPVGTPTADQTTVFSVENNATSGWVSESAELDLSSGGQYVLQAFGEQIPGTEGFTDFVLQQDQTSTTPEPDSALLLTAAGAVLLVFRRRRVCCPHSTGVERAL
jgi:MYXO-CTERM domain-containing protein